MISAIEKTDPEIAGIITRENNRLASTLELIASENVVSPAVMAATGSSLTNKYAEGYPGRRYYGGCRFVDEAEKLAISRARRLFGVDYVNVQPHSGSQANMAVMLAMLRPGDPIMGMSLDCGGHLTHGAGFNFSGTLYQNHPYGVDRETGRLDYDEIAALARRVKPKMIVCGASAYPRLIDFAAFRRIADSVGACLLADIAHIAGLVVGGQHPSPVGHAHFITSTTHKTLRGPRGGLIMSSRKHARLLNKWIFPGIQGGPLMHVIAAKAVAFQEALNPDFRTYQAQVVKNSRALAAALSAQGVRLVTGGTDNHLVLVDLGADGTTGAEAETALEEIGISTNKNMVPFDRRDARSTSGLRLGTPAVTTRGMKEPEMALIAELIAGALRDGDRPEARRELAGRVSALCRRFPLAIFD